MAGVYRVVSGIIKKQLVWAVGRTNSAGGYDKRRSFAHSKISFGLK
jgi:hypothetical protein